MRIRYIIENLAEKLTSRLSNNEKRYFDGFTIMPENLHLTFGNIYTVLGIEYTIDGYVNFMIADDTGVSYPKFYPIEFFEVIDNRTSKYWINRTSYTYPLDEIGYPNLVSFEAAVNDECFFDDLLECSNSASEIYEKYKALMESEFPDRKLNIAEIIDDFWVMCSQCDAVWEIDKDQGIVSCPQYGHKSNNPFWNKNEV